MSGRKDNAPKPAVVYPPGWFTEPARAWGVISPSMEQGLPVHVLQQRQRTLNTQRSRELALATGSGWACGTVVMPRTPKLPRPMWLVRVPAGRGKGGAA